MDGFLCDARGEHGCGKGGGIFFVVLVRVSGFARIVGAAADTHECDACIECHGYRGFDSCCGTGGLCRCGTCGDAATGRGAGAGISAIDLAFFCSGAGGAFAVGPFGGRIWWIGAAVGNRAGFIECKQFASGTLYRSGCVGGDDLPVAAGAGTTKNGRLRSLARPYRFTETVRQGEGVGIRLVFGLKMQRLAARTIEVQKKLSNLHFCIDLRSSLPVYSLYIGCGYFSPDTP